MAVVDSEPITGQIFWFIKNIQLLLPLLVVICRGVTAMFQTAVP